MKCFRNSIFTVAAALAILSTASLPVAAQEIQRLSNGKPDLNGVWDHPRVGDMTKSSTECASGSAGCKQTGMAQLPYAAWGLEKWKQPVHFDYTARCLPWGYSRTLGTEYPLEMIQTPQRLAILFESNNVFHVIPTDGRPHLPANIRQWRGDSRGHWEGGTLVVDTTNFTSRTAFRGSTESLHVIERFTRTAEDIILYEFTVEDPATWTKPWTGEYSWPTSSGPIYEYACHEGNYAMKDILKGARLREKEEAAKGVKTKE